MDAAVHACKQLSRWILRECRRVRPFPANSPAPTPSSGSHRWLAVALVAAVVAGIHRESVAFPVAGAHGRTERTARIAGDGSPRPARMLSVTDSDLQLVGTYVGRAPADDAAKRTFSLVLSEGGSALWNTFYLGKAHATLTGHWLQTGSQVVVNFDAFDSGASPRPITFRYHHHELDPVQWDQNEWGREGPPVLHRARGRSAAMAS